MCSCSESSAPDKTQNPTIVTKTEPEPEPSDNNIVSPTANFTFAKASDIKKADDTFKNDLSSFSVELFKNSVKYDLANGKNTLVSPESVAFALGMTMNGAKGETLSQMQDLLCRSSSTDTFNTNMNRLITKANSDENIKFNIANSVWVKDSKDITLTEQFAKTCKELYNADMFKAPFDKKTVDAINSWVNEKTDKMIPSIINELDADTRAVLINCIAFDAKWAKPYKEDQVSENQTFTNADGKETTCTMLTGKESRYISDENAQGFIKSYQGGKYAFMAILPNEGVSLSDYVSSMTADSFAKLYASNTGEYDVFTRLPKFSYDYDITLNNTLADMGMANAFTDAADFTNLSSGAKLHIGSVLHKTHIDLDAEGTKAAAATAVTMDVSAAAMEQNIKRVYLDRPFAYAIIETDTGLPVFMGTVCDPSAK